MMNISITRRGWAALAVVGFCLVMAWEYGAPALNAIVVPLVVVLLAAAITVSRASHPTIRRHPVAEGFVGDTRTVELSIDAGGPIAGIVHDRVGDGLEATSTIGECTLTSDSRCTYDVTLGARGVHTVGPVAVGVRDVLGLTKRWFDDDGTESVLVYPKLYDLRRASGSDLEILTEAVSDRQREEFDHLREYERGDSLRDVHWKSTAKRADQELVVKEFVADENLGAVDLVAESERGFEDEMASAAASVATYLLEMGVSVGVSAPDGTQPGQTGRNHHVEILRLFARTGPGGVSDRARGEADVRVRADGNGTVVVVDGQEIPFERFCAGDGPTTASEAAAESPASDTSYNSPVDSDAGRDSDSDADTGYRPPGVSA